MKNNVPWPFTPECRKCHGQKWRNSVENLIVYFCWMDDQVNGGQFAPICCGCIWEELKQYGFVALPLDRERNREQKSAVGEKRNMIKDKMVGGWIKGGMIPSSGHKDVITGSEIDDNGKFGARVVLTFKTGLEKCKKVSVNETSLGLLVEAWGRDEKRFIGKNVLLTCVEISGKLSIIVEPVK